MGEIHSPLPVKYFCGVLLAEAYPWDEAAEEMIRRWGEFDLVSEPVPFTFTGYYREEMGAAVIRRFVSFRDLHDPAGLADWKILANDLEVELGRRRETGMRRPVNLDPGYLELGKLILASTKNFFHRLYLRDGIYGEVTLYYRDRVWQPFPWTFPDYAGPAYRDFFQAVRRMYHRQLKELSR